MDNLINNTGLKIRPTDRKIQTTTKEIAEQAGFPMEVFVEKATNSEDGFWVLRSVPFPSKQLIAKYQLISVGEAIIEYAPTYYESITE